jgi:hypothetical protein
MRSRVDELLPIAEENEGFVTAVQARSLGIKGSVLARLTQLCVLPGFVSGQSDYRGQGAPPRHPACREPCGHSLWRSKTYLGAKFRRLRARLGAPKAITAMAHMLARLVYRMLRYGEQYVDKGMMYYEEKYREHGIRSIQKKAKDLGLVVTLTTAA